MNDTRGVSPVIGFALLVGLAAIGSVTLFAVGMSVTSDTQSAIEEQQIEDSMSEFASTTNDLAVGETRSAAFSLARSDDATVTADGEAGNINVTLRLDDDDDLVLIDDQPLGQLEYATRDGPTFTYQGGGIWRQDRHGDPVMVQPPNFEYRSGPREEPTLTFSLVRITDGDRITDGTGSIEVDERRAHYPTGERSNPMGDGTVEIAVESEYCEAWRQHFTQRTTGAVSEHCDEGTDSEVVVELIVPEQLIDEIEHAAIASDPDDIHVAGGEIDGGQAYGDLPSVTDSIDQRVEVAEDGDGFTSPDDIDDPGQYNFTSIDEDVSIDADGDPVDVVVRDEIDLDGESITVSGSSDVRFHIAEGASVDVNDGIIGNDSDSSQTTLYVHSDADGAPVAVDVGPGGKIFGVVYAPNSGIDVNGEDAEIVGAAIADDIQLSGNPTGITYDESLSDKTLDVVAPDDGQRIYYLHVSETTMRISD